jgi:hypothetical protein
MTRRRGPAALAWAASAFLAGQAALVAVADFARPGWADPYYGDRMARLRLELRRPAVTVVAAMGSSRTEFAVMPDTVTPPGGAARCVNFAVPGHAAPNQWLDWQRLRAAGVRPHVLLVEVVPAFLVEGRGAEVYFHGERLTPADLARLRPWCDDARGLWGVWLADRLTAWHSRRNVVLARYAPSLLPDAALAPSRPPYLSMVGNPDVSEHFDPERRRRAYAAAREGYEWRLRQFAPGRTPDAMLRALVGEARADGVCVVLFTTPESDTFRGWYHEAEPAVAGYLADLGRDLGVPVIDARGWLPGDEFYIDGHHMLPCGAQAFSRRLAVELRRLGVLPGGG